MIGGIDTASVARAIALFARLGPARKVSSPEAAEALKLFANAQRDATFAVANSFALICEELGLDYGEICRAGSDSYQRFASVRAGPVGGPCLPKDTLLLADSVPRPELARLPLAARATNALLVEHVARAVEAHCAAREVRPAVVAVLGLSFKGDPPTADRRGSFGVAVAKRLAVHSAWTIRTFEPTTEAEKSLMAALRGADVAIIANNHPRLCQLDLGDAAAAMSPGGLIYDACGAIGADPLPLPNAVAFHAFGNGRSGARA